jgi:small subunit ribosomal protein S20
VATHKSAAKRHRQSLKRRARNHALKARLRTLVKKVRSALDSKDVAAAESELRVAARALDRAVTKGVVHRNSASRRISRLAHRLEETRKSAG